MNILFIGLLISQNLFAKTYGGLNSDNARSIALTMDGGYVIVGGTRSFGAGQSDLLVVRIDSAGNIIWARTFGGDTSDWAQSIIQTADGGFVVAGNTMSFGAGNCNILVLRLDASGSLSWARTFGGINSERIGSMIQVADGGFVLVGYTSSFDVGNGDLLALKLSPSGNLEWARAYGTTTDLEDANSVIQTPDGGYVIGGYIGTTLTDVLVLRIDFSGNPIWTRVFGGPWYESARSVAQVLDGGYVVAGGSDSWFPHSQDFQVIKIDTSGTMEWARIYGDTAHADTAYSEQAFSIISTLDGGLILVGYQWISGSNIFRLLLVKTNSSGGVIWARMFGDTGIQAPSSMIRALDGGYVVAGGIGSTLGINNLLVMKLDTAGNYPDCLEDYELSFRSISPVLYASSLTVTLCTLLVGTPDLTITTPDLTVTNVCSPVMAEETGASPSGSLTLLPVPGGFWITSYSGEARIYDPAGRLLLSKKIKGKTLISPLKPGVYFVVAGKQRARIAIR